MKRLTLLPDPRFVPLYQALEERMQRMATAIAGGDFVAFLDPLMTRTVEHAFRHARAHEGTIWICNAEESYLVPVLNTGPRKAEFVGRFQQPLTSGVISMVFAKEQPFCENDVYKNALQDKTVDRTLGLLTCAMIAVPLHYAGRIRGVLSCVKVRSADSREADPPPFQLEDLAAMQWGARALEKIVDGRLLAIATGWEVASAGTSDGSVAQP